MRLSRDKSIFIQANGVFFLSTEVAKEERPELQKKTYKWNTKEEAKQAFKELLKEKVSLWSGCQIRLSCNRAEPVTKSHLGIKLSVHKVSCIYLQF